ncbi:hypothetical protein EUTSA_v10028223mg [Eutrema salsugineum]|uniref:FBD domain-containing protein n=1 Tax=Eutrema salsugineum TaxID=72664 RepID=V4NLB2_EUTSA|nr:hypothetical protein EUTSA_v10028223mg [Eutrema salsugineum]
MGRISELPNDLLIKILSFLPTKVAVSTSILSKQWEFLWMWLPKLVYTSSCCYSKSEDKRLKCFLDRNLPLHKTPVIESLRLYFRYPHLEPGDIKLWVLTVVSRYVLELEISYFTYQNEQDILSSSLYTCKSLVTLKLNGMILVDVPRMVCLPCLKTLRLECMTYLNEDSLQQLLSNCPVLKDLFVQSRGGNNLRKFIVIVPSLKRLTFLGGDDHLDEIVVKTPSLKYLDFTYYSFKIHHCLIENMPKLSEAYVNVSFPILERLIGSITSVKRLTLLQVDYGSEDVYGGGFVFNQLVHLNLRMYQRYSLNVQVRLLKDSPKLRLLGLDLCRSRRDVHGTNGVIFWNQQSTVPECMLSSLQTFKFSGYLGRPEEKDLVIYVLKNAHHLKTATILFNNRFFEKNRDMIQELALSPRASTECQLVFDR